MSFIVEAAGQHVAVMQVDIWDDIAQKNQQMSIMEVRGIPSHVMR